MEQLDTRARSPKAERRDALAARWAAQVETYRAAVTTFQQAVRRAARREELRRYSPSVVAPPAAVAGPLPVAATPPALAAASERRAAPDGVVDGQPASPLTRRQLEVAALIARGYTNRQIADALVLTKGTVANHVEHILHRLDFSCRSQIAVWAAERGLLSRDRDGRAGSLPRPADGAGASRAG